MKAKKPEANKPQGIRLDPEIYNLTRTAAGILGVGVGDVFTEIAAEWLRRQVASDPTVKSLVEHKCSGNSELRALIYKKPGLQANRA